MAYVTRMLAPEETLIGVSRLHWIFLIQGLLWLIGMMAIGFMIDSVLAMVFGALIPSVRWGFMGVQTTWIELFFLAAGIYIFLVYYIKVATTEIALTNERIIHKWGWIFVKVKEMNIGEIKGSNIDLGMLGRFLGYGKIGLDAKFIKDAEIPWINKPYRFARALTEAQEAIEQRMTMVIENTKPSEIRLRPSDHVKNDLPDNNASYPPKDNMEPYRQRQRREERIAQPKFMDEPGEPSAPKARGLVKEISEAVDELKSPIIFQQAQEKNKQPQPQQAQPPAPPTDQDMQDSRPQAVPHEVAEGSYEEEKLKEELIEEWTENSEDEATQDPPSRRIH